ncbi:MAG: DNA-binding protein, partial [Prevotella sp.]|nr:DNA-binding protein [Prevotella sp.]
KFTASNIKSVNLVFKPAVELQNLIKDATFTQVSSRKVQAAVLAAEKKGEGTVDIDAAKNK